MSRARSVLINDERFWFDVNQNHRKATDEQLELLTMLEDVDFDELLESNITQGDVITRLRSALGTNAIPEDVILRRDKWRADRQVQPECRLCGKVGDSTKHHFVPKWILRELSGYSSKWSNRRDNCIPACIDCHRDLHDRNGSAKSIVGLLTDKEKEFADRALTALSEERPKLMLLIARGDDAVYEARLAKDWIEGFFSSAASATVSGGNLADLRMLA